MQANYETALAKLLLHEGGYGNHPNDPGGPTKYGITIHDYRKYIDRAGTAADVKAMSVDQAKSIYRSKYWEAQRCDDLPSGVDYAVFDYGVNSGIGRSGKVLRRVLGMPDSTHVVTNAVIAAAQKRDAAEIVNAICDERLAFLKRLKTWPVFGKGWERRVKEVRRVSLGMAKPKEAEKPAIKSKTIWAQIVAVLTTIGGALTDWRVAAVIVVGLLAAYVIYERMNRPDIKGWFK
jgi:lysozyme family protein